MRKKEIGGSLGTEEISAGNNNVVRAEVPEDENHVCAECGKSIDADGSNSQPNKKGKRICFNCASKKKKSNGGGSGGGKNNYSDGKTTKAGKSTSCEFCNKHVSTGHLDSWLVEAKDRRVHFDCVQDRFKQLGVDEEQLFALSGDNYEVLSKNLVLNIYSSLAEEALKRASDKGEANRKTKIIQNYLNGAANAKFELLEEINMAIGLEIDFDDLVKVYLAHGKIPEYLFKDVYKPGLKIVVLPQESKDKKPHQAVQAVG